MRFPSKSGPQERRVWSVSPIFSSLGTNEPRNYLSVSALVGFVLLGVAWAAPAICQHLYGSRELGALGRLAILNVILNAISTLYLSILQTVREMRSYILFDQGSTALELALGVALIPVKDCRSHSYAPAVSMWRSLFGVFQENERSLTQEWAR
jgi:hypothetical protein